MAYYQWKNNGRSAPPPLRFFRPQVPPPYGFDDLHRAFNDFGRGNNITMRPPIPDNFRGFNNMTGNMGNRYQNFTNDHPRGSYPRGSRDKNSPSHHSPYQKFKESTNNFTQSSKNNSSTNQSRPVNSTPMNNKNNSSSSSKTTNNATTSNHNYTNKKTPSNDTSNKKTPSNDTSNKKTSSNNTSNKKTTSNRCTTSNSNNKASNTNKPSKNSNLTGNNSTSNGRSNYKSTTEHSPKRRTRAETVLLENLTSKSQWDRTFYPKKNTLMHKAAHLEASSGAQVAVIVWAPTEEQFYYTSSEVLKKALKKSGLLRKNAVYENVQGLQMHPSDMSFFNSPNSHRLLNLGRCTPDNKSTQSASKQQQATNDDEDAEIEREAQNVRFAAQRARRLAAATAAQKSHINFQTPGKSNRTTNNNCGITIVTDPPIQSQNRPLLSSSSSESSMSDDSSDSDDETREEKLESIKRRIAAVQQANEEDCITIESSSSEEDIPQIEVPSIPITTKKKKLVKKKPTKTNGGNKTTEAPETKPNRSDLNQATANYTKTTSTSTLTSNRTNENQAIQESREKKPTQSELVRAAHTVACRKIRKETPQQQRGTVKIKQEAREKLQAILPPPEPKKTQSPPEQPSMKRKAGGSLQSEAKKQRSDSDDQSSQIDKQVHEKLSKEDDQPTEEQRRIVHAALEAKSKVGNLTVTERKLLKQFGRRVAVEIMERGAKKLTMEIEKHRGEVPDYDMNAIEIRQLYWTFESRSHKGNFNAAEWKLLEQFRREIRLEKKQKEINELTKSIEEHKQKDIYQEQKKLFRQMIHRIGTEQNEVHKKLSKVDDQPTKEERKILHAALEAKSKVGNLTVDELELLKQIRRRATMEGMERKVNKLTNSLKVLKEEIEKHWSEVSEYWYDMNVVEMQQLCSGLESRSQKDNLHADEWKLLEQLRREIRLEKTQKEINELTKLIEKLKRKSESQQQKQLFQQMQQRIGTEKNKTP